MQHQSLFLFGRMIELKFVKVFFAQLNPGAFHVLHILCGSLFPFGETSRLLIRLQQILSVQIVFFWPGQTGRTLAELICCKAGCCSLLTYSMMWACTSLKKYIILGDTYCTPLINGCVQTQKSSHLSAGRVLHTGDNSSSVSGLNKAPVSLLHRI